MPVSARMPSFRTFSVREPPETEMSRTATIPHFSADSAVSSPPLMRTVPSLFRQWSGVVTFTRPPAIVRLYSA